MVRLPQEQGFTFGRRQVCQSLVDIFYVLVEYIDVKLVLSRLGQRLSLGSVCRQDFSPLHQRHYVFCHDKCIHMP
jgi:hypothetical protein